MMSEQEFDAIVTRFRKNRVLTGVDAHKLLRDVADRLGVQYRPQSLNDRKNSKKVKEGNDPRKTKP